MNSQDVKGRPVISIVGGTKVGTINHVYLDLAAKRVVGFSIATEGHRFGGATEPGPTVATSAVRSLGPDAMMVEDVAAAHAAWVAGDYREVLTADDLDGRKVVTEGGTEVGQVASVEFDEGTFAITGLEVSPGLFRTKTEIPADRLVRIGPDIVVVTDAVAAGVDPSAKAAGD